MAKAWTEEEINILAERHGNYSLASTAKLLGRSLSAVQIKAGRLRLGDNRRAGELITVFEVAKILNISPLTLKRFKKHGLRIRGKVTCNTKKYYFIKIEDFWEWAKDNKELINWTLLEKNALGGEPKWVDEERRKILSLKRQSKYRGVWTKKEEALLLRLHKTKTQREIAQKMGRNECSISNKLNKLEGRTYKKIKWTILEVNKLKFLYNKGLNNKEIALNFNRSLNSVRGKVSELIKKGELNERT